jgi:hypothetical protein
LLNTVLELLLEPPEPLLELALYWKVMSVIAWSMVSAAPSTLAVKALPPVLESKTSEPETAVG